MRWRCAEAGLLTVLTILILAAAPWVVGGGSESDHFPFQVAAPAAADVPSAVYATVGSTPTGQPMPPNFLGLSLEYSALPTYAGGEGSSIDPVFVQLLRNLTPAAGQSLVLRFGGDSTDSTWWPIPGVKPPAGVNYALTSEWLGSGRSLASALGARVILGVNLAAGEPRLAAAEARALVMGVGPANVMALEIGNEPDVYGVFPWYLGRRGAVHARTASYGPAAYARELARWAGALPPETLAGPAFAELPWMASLPSILAAAPALRVVTVHRYALQGCLTDPGSPSYPSIANLFSDRSSRGLAQAIAPYVAFAHARGLQFRVDELNSAALAGCIGRTGVSDTFASALWMIDTLFSMAGVGVDGVNVHSLPGAAYQLFTFDRAGGAWSGGAGGGSFAGGASSGRTGGGSSDSAGGGSSGSAGRGSSAGGASSGRAGGGSSAGGASSGRAGGPWQASVRPDYYGLLMFSQAFPPGAQLLPVAAPDGPVRVWATRAPDGHVRVVVINEDSRAHLVQLQLPAGAGQANLEWLRAPTATATSGVTLGGQTFGTETATGLLPAPAMPSIPQLLGSYSVDVPAASSVLLTR